MLDILPMCWL